MILLHERVSLHSNANGIYIYMLIILCDPWTVRRQYMLIRVALTAEIHGQCTGIDKVHDLISQSLLSSETPRQST